MSTPFCRLLIAALLSWQGDAQTAASSLFRGRELQASKASPGSSPELKELLASKLAVEYRQIEPKRSLLLSDCVKSEWCTDAEFSFGKVFGLAAGAQSAAAAKNWYASAVGSLSLKHYEQFFTGPLLPWSGDSAATAPFQLLAIVNRMDLAAWDDKAAKWSGAEVRFVYGPKPINKIAPKFTLILEFQLPPCDWSAFQGLAEAWKDMGRAEAAAVPARLKSVLALSGYKASNLIRLRMNVALTSDAVWAFGQWEFHPGGNPRAALPVITQLNDQIDLQYVGATPVAAAALPGYEDYLRLWSAAPSTAGFVGTVAVPPGLWQNSPAIYQNVAMSTPVPLNACGQDFLPGRNVLALQQCSGCHTSETGAKFTHIANRDAGRNAVLSGFLTGSAAALKKTSLTDLYYGRGGNSIRVAFQVYSPAGKCQSQVSSVTVRSFNDVARRALFMAALLASPQPGDGAFRSAAELVQKFSAVHTD